MQVNKNLNSAGRLLKQRPNHIQVYVLLKGVVNNR